MQHFIEFPTLIFFCKYFNVAYEQLYGFVFSTSSLQCLAHLKCTSFAEAETAKRYSKISIILIVEDKSQISKRSPEIAIGKQGWQVCGLA